MMNRKKGKKKGEIHTKSFGKANGRRNIDSVCESIRTIDYVVLLEKKLRIAFLWYDVNMFGVIYKFVAIKKIKKSSFAYPFAVYACVAGSFRFSIRMAQKEVCQR